MSELEQIGVISGIIVSLISILTTLYMMFFSFASIKFKVELMWRFVMEHAISEGLHKQVISHNSPLAVTMHGRELMAPYLSKITAWCIENCQQMNDVELFTAIEHQFGATITKCVSIPSGVYTGALVMATLIMVRESEKIDSSKSNDVIFPMNIN